VRAWRRALEARGSFCLAWMRRPCWLAVESAPRSRREVSITIRFHYYQSHPGGGGGGGVEIDRVCPLLCTDELVWKLGAERRRR
jgi:hypothetical protein